MKIRSINPHDQSEVGTLTVSTKQDVKKVVNKARGACEIWKNVPIEKRVAYIKKYRTIVEKNQEKIARSTTREMGKPIRQSRDEVTWELEFLDYYANTGPLCLADETVHKKNTEHFWITYEPYGVCACIAPWNFPLSMANSGIIPALIAGNTVILKPSEYTSLTQKIVTDMLEETGIPEGVVNLVIGDGRVGRMLIGENVDLVWFTGSTQVGREIYEKCGMKLTKALLEMGGSSPGIIFADADLDNALENLFWSRFLNCGQVCSAVKRLYVEKPVYEEVVKRFVEKLKTAKIGNPLDEDTDIGPLVSRKQKKILEEQVADAMEKGAKRENISNSPRGTELQNGNYVDPIILTSVTPNMKVVTEEVFGPVLPIIPFRTEEEAVERANASEYGLSAEVYTTDMDKAQRVAAKIHSGTVAVNTDNFFKPQCPFGGFKKSGMGREYGEIGMKEFSQVKVMAVKKPSRRGI